MGEQTKISWCDSTLNIWVGCEKIGAGCKLCYASDWAKRYGRDFSKRTLTTVANRTQPFKWNAGHEDFWKAHKRRRRVFVNSLADVFDNKAPQEWRESLWRTIRMTPFIDYLILTKRIGNAPRMLPADFNGMTYPNVWLGISVCIQEDLDRDLKKLLDIHAAIHFISAEPLTMRVVIPAREAMHKVTSTKQYVDWLICGGESGHKARRLEPLAACYLMRQCEMQRIEFWMKQGSQTVEWGKNFRDMESWPAELRKQFYPISDAEAWYSDMMRRSNGKLPESTQLELY